jgi:hypothetical protein
MCADGYTPPVAISPRSHRGRTHRSSSSYSAQPQF